jgi:cbb3-type cytochrome oxidase maturation protein
LEIIYLLIAVSIFLVIIIAAVFIWAAKTGQYDDLEKPRHQILMDDDEHIKKDDDT